MQLKEILIEHMVHTEDNKDRLLQAAACRKEKKELEKLVDHYLRRVETLLQNSADETVSRLPFAIIGSRVTVEDLDNREAWTVRLTSPLQESTAAEDVSFLSPLGRALLLKGEGEKLEAQTGAEKQALLVKEIHHPGMFP